MITQSATSDHPPQHNNNNDDNKMTNDDNDNDAILQVTAMWAPVMKKAGGVEPSFLR